MQHNCDWITINLMETNHQTDRMFHTGIYYNVPCYIIQSGSIFNKNKHWRRKGYFFWFYWKLDIMHITLATDDLLIKLVKWSQNSLRWVRVRTISSQKVARSAANWSAQDEGWGRVPKWENKNIEWLTVVAARARVTVKEHKTFLFIFWWWWGGTNHEARWAVHFSCGSELFL